MWLLVVITIMIVFGLVPYRSLAYTVQVCLQLGMTLDICFHSHIANSSSQKQTSIIHCPLNLMLNPNNKHIIWSTPTTEKEMWLFLLNALYVHQLVVLMQDR